MWLSPSTREECYADPAAIACDYPEDVLIKVASAKLEEKAPDVLAFLEKFTITTEDQLSMLPAVEIDGEDASAVSPPNGSPTTRTSGRPGSARKPTIQGSFDCPAIEHPDENERGGISAPLGYDGDKRRFDPQLAGAQEMRLKRRDG